MSENSANSTPQPNGPSKEHKLLDVLVGKWNAEGITKDGRTVAIHAVDTYEWLPGGYFMMHRTAARVGDDEYESVEIIGYDAELKAYPMRFFDSWGQTGTYQATVHANIWKIVGDSGRATLVVSDDGQSMTANWEMSPNGSDWHPWMDLKLTKAT